jgi:hypothetical protein
VTFKTSSKSLSNTGEPFLWGSYDTTTTPSNETQFIDSDTGFDRAFAEFGTSVAVGSGRIVVGTYGGGGGNKAFIFDLDGTQLAKITPGSYTNFGQSVAVGSGRIVVGDYGDNDNGASSGAVYIYNLNGTQLAKIKASDGVSYDRFGWSIAVGSGRIVVGAPYVDDNGSNSGAAYIFDLDGNQVANKIKPSDGATSDFFAGSSAVAVGSGRIVIGSTGDDDNGTSSGSAYIYDLDGNLISKIKPSDAATSDGFGRGVAVGSGRIVVGAPGDDDNGTSSGSAYIFDLDGTQLAKIKASDGAASDYFGQSIAVGSGRIVVGAQYVEDGQGSAYVFDLDGNQLAKITASDNPAGDFVHFGQSVAVRCGRIVVGAPSADDAVTGYPFSGVAYIWNTPKVYTPYDLKYNEI